MRVIRHLAGVALLLGAVVLPSDASALTCARPWGADDLADARMALTEGFGAGGFDGFLIAKVTGTASGPNGSVSKLGLAVSVAFGAVVPRDMDLGVGPHGPMTTFQAGHAYFLTLHKSTDSTLPLFFVDPCGPAFEVSSSTQMNSLLGLRSDETIVDGGYLSALRQSLSGDDRVRTLAIVTAGASFVVAIGLFLIQRRRAAARGA